MDRDIILWCYLSIKMHCFNCFQCLFCFYIFLPSQIEWIIYWFVGDSIIQFLHFPVLSRQLIRLIWRSQVFLGKFWFPQKMWKMGQKLPKNVFIMFFLSKSCPLMQKHVLHDSVKAAYPGKIWFLRYGQIAISQWDCSIFESCISREPLG